MGSWVHLLISVESAKERDTNHITWAAYAARTHTVLDVFAYAGHVGAHFGNKSCTYYSFVSKVMCTKFGAERSASHFTQGVPLAMAAILAAIFWKKLTKSCT